MLAKVVEVIEEKGGVLNVLRQYQKKIIIAEQMDSQSQRESFL